MFTYPKNCSPRAVALCAFIQRREHAAVAFLVVSYAPPHLGTDDMAVLCGQAVVGRQLRQPGSVLALAFFALACMCVCVYIHV
jgi:hypothetical protein